MGCVYSGVDRSTRSAVAIKVVQASSRRQLAALERFLREARSAAAVNHPAVVRMLHVDVSDDGMLYQAQELVVGETLERRLRADPVFTPGAAARLVSVLSEALAAAHAEGVVHRDVKPANIMLTSDEPGLKLLDFGISKLHQDEEWAAGATLPGTVLGTPAYMSPEQVTGGNLTDSVDVYAVGVLLFELLTGRHPFQDDPSRDVLTHHLVSVPPEAHELAPGVPPSLSALARACLHKTPAERPSAAELAHALRAFADQSNAPMLEGAAPRQRTEQRTAVEGRRRLPLASGAD
jgi:serine/threonine-protein kinase